MLNPTATSWGIFSTIGRGQKMMGVGTSTTMSTNEWTPPLLPQHPFRFRCRRCLLMYHWNYRQEEVLIKAVIITITKMATLTENTPRWIGQRDGPPRRWRRWVDRWQRRYARRITARCQQVCCISYKEQPTRKLALLAHESSNSNLDLQWCLIL